MSNVIKIDRAKQKEPFISVFQFDQEEEGFLSVYTARIRVSQKEFTLHRVGNVPYSKDNLEFMKLTQSKLLRGDDNCWYQPVEDATI